MEFSGSSGNITPPMIYNGSRGEDFKSVLMACFKRGNIKQHYIDMLLDDYAMEQFGNAFTCDSVDPENNYQVMEQLGDLSGNKFIVGYMYARFPQLKCSSGVKIVARLRIVYGAKNSFSLLGEKLGFWPFISATNVQRERMKKSLLEDVFEAFLGTVESILDMRLTIGVGYAVVYSILKSLFDEMPISLEYENLFDAKTRLKELFDTNKQLGTLLYEEFTEKVNNFNQVMSTCYMIQVDMRGYKNKVRIGAGRASIKQDAQQKAAQDSLQYLSKHGYKKDIPPEYKMLSGTMGN